MVDWEKEFDEQFPMLGRSKEIKTFIRKLIKEVNEKAWKKGYNSSYKITKVKLSRAFRDGERYAKGE